MTELKSAALQALSLMDLTTLNDDDTDARVEALCRSAITPVGKVAAVCIYPQFIPTAKRVFAELGEQAVKIATVTNFPHGNSDIAVAVSETRQAVELGADEVDVVFPFRALMSGDENVGFELVAQCKAVCGDVKLKVIIEVGELKTAELIEKASEISIKAGADFIKTSTGKVPVNATPESAQIMLNVIAKLNVQDNVGFKAAGGVKSAEDAMIYLNMAADLFGDEWVNPQHFRFGASSLLANLLNTLDVQQDIDTGASSY